MIWAELTVEQVYLSRMRQAGEHLQDKFSTEEIFLLRVENKIDPQVKPSWELSKSNWALSYNWAEFLASLNLSKQNNIKSKVKSRKYLHFSL